MRAKVKFSLFITIVTLCLSVWLKPAAAATGVIYLSPSSTSVKKDNNVTLSLRINPGTSVDSVQATVNYSQSYLKFVSSSIGYFSTCAVDSGGSGLVKFACAKLGGSTSSDSLIASITFKALAGSGHTSLSVTGANAAKAGSYTNPSASGATVSFSSSSSTSNSGGSTYYGGSTSTTTSTAGTAKKTKAKPVKTTVATSDIQFSSTVLKVSVSAPAEVYVQYGTSKDKLERKTRVTKVSKSASIDLPSANLLPGTEYFYQIVAKNADGVISKSSIQSFTTKGLTVKVTVLDKDYSPLVNKTVTLHSATVQTTTDQNGVAIFSNVAPGMHHLEYQDGSKTYTRSVYVDNDVTESAGKQTAAVQTAAVILSGYLQPVKKTSVSAIITAILIVALLAVGLGILAGKITSHHLNAVKNQVLPQPQQQSKPAKPKKTPKTA